MPYIYNNKENVTVLNLYRDAIGDTGLENDIPKSPAANPNPPMQVQIGAVQKMWAGTKEYLRGPNYIKHVGLNYISPRMPNDPLFLNEDTKPYAVLYDLLHSYQEQKKKRNFGSNYDEHVLLDHRYTVTSLILHKVTLILSAAPDQKELHKTHLANFITALSKKPELLKSSSDDSHSISLDSTLLATQIILQKEIDQELFKGESAAATEKLDYAKKRLVSVINATNSLLLRLTIPKDLPANLSNIDELPFLANNDQFREALNGPYCNFIDEFFLSKPAPGMNLPENISATAVRNTIADSDAIIFDKNILHHLTDLINYRNKLINLKNSIENENVDLKNLGRVATLMESIQETTIDMVKKLAQLKEALADLYLQKGRAHKTQAKRNFMSVNWMELRSHLHTFLDDVNDALMRIRLVFSGQQPDLSDSLSLSVTALEKSTHVDTPSAHRLEDSFVLLQDDSKSKILEAEKNELEESWALINSSNTEKDAEIEQLKLEIATLKKEKKQFKTASKAAKENLELALSANSMNDKVEKYRSVFHEFIDDYIKHNKASSIWTLFGNFHGYHGRDVAARILSAFDNMLDDLKTNKTLTPDNLNRVIIDRFITMLIANKKDLDGNFNPHSLKTYLLAYANLLTDMNINQILPVVEYHQNVFVGTNRNIEKMYQNKLGLVSLDAKQGNRL